MTNAKVYETFKIILKILNYMHASKKIIVILTAINPIKILDWIYLINLTVRKCFILEIFKRHSIIKCGRKKTEMSDNVTRLAVLFSKKKARNYLRRVNSRDINGDRQ